MSLPEKISNRYRALRNIFLGAASLATFSSCTGTNEKYNVLFIAVDDLRLNLSCYGDSVALTPNIDRLAGQGTLFRRAYSQQAVSNASRQSLLTGCRPDEIKVWDLVTHFRQTRPDIVPLPEYFKNNGYFAKSIGKIYHDNFADPPAWSVPEEYEAVPKIEDYRLFENRKPYKGQKAAATEFAEFPDSLYPDGIVASAAVAQIREFASKRQKQPFFLAVGIRKPHLPFTSPKRFWNMYDPAKIPPAEQPLPPTEAPTIALHNSEELRGYSDMLDVGDFSPEEVQRLRHGYYAATSFADAQIGRLLDALEKTGLSGNTVVILWSDHGYHLGEHGLWCKTTNYEADTRVPLIVSVPDKRPKGVVTDAMVELVDIYPTLTELCGLPRKKDFSGKSFTANIGNSVAPGKNAVYSQFPRPWPNKKQPEVMGYAVRTKTHRYIEWRKFGTNDVLARELYTYPEDKIFESENLANSPEYSTRVKELSEMLNNPKTEQ